VIWAEHNLEDARQIITYEPDLIIHCAARVGSRNCEKDYLDSYQSNVVGTVRMALVAKELGVKFVYMSSVDVYKFGGTNALKILSEVSDLGPHTMYGRTKLEGEKICQELLSDYLILRLAYIYGPDDPHSLISHVLRGGTVDMVGDYKKDYLYIDDCAKAIESLIAKKSQGIFNVSSGQNYSVTSILRKLGCNDFKFSDQDYTKNFIMDCDKLKTETGWKPAINLWEKIEELKGENHIKV
jgi:dTDP-4-dehydrorhamnose reductase